MTSSSALDALGAVHIRPAAGEDHDALYDICVRTGASGSDASEFYRYPSLLGDVFVGPYLALEPDFAFVAARTDGPQGYVLGALDTAAFDARCDREWWPGRRRQYAGVEAGPGSRDAWLLGWIETPPDTPGFVDRFPSHLHIDLLPSLQGGGWGRRLITTECAALRAHGSTGVHLGVARDNVNAVGFYQHLGFREIDGVDPSMAEHTLWMGLPLS
jgi:ribosomal protein S18 acetylase RimI-like enzyme